MAACLRTRHLHALCGAPLGAVRSLHDDLWVPNWSSTSGGLGIFVDQSAKPIVASEAKAGLGRWRQWPEWCCVPQGAVGAVLVEMRRVLGQYVFEVAPVEDQYSVEQLAADGADPSFGDRVRAGRAHRCAQDADAFAGEHGIKDVGELGIPVPDQELQRCHAFAEVHQQIPCLLSHPRSARAGRDSQKMHAAGGMFHEKQHIQSLAQQCVDAEKVGGNNALCLGGQECRQVGPSRRGAGSMPARLRIDHTVLGAIG